MGVTPAHYYIGAGTLKPEIIMGTLRNAWATGSNRLGRGEVGRRAFPLRKITGSDGEYEILECGHRGAFHLSVGRDLFSTYQPANSRRCRECYKASQEMKH